jgi:hypothetical protein
LRKAVVRILRFGRPEGVRGGCTQDNIAKSYHLVQKPLAAASDLLRTGDFPPR